MSSDCVAKASSGDCSFYDCFEQRFQCGSHGYALAYGGKYCRRLEGARDIFTDAVRMRVCEKERKSARAHVCVCVCVCVCVLSLIHI